MAYADYTYYTGTYLGTAIAESAFPALALRASAQVDQITFGRAATDTTNTNAIKNAMCAIAEELQRQDAVSGADAVTSESQGNYSVSYAANSSKTRTNQQRIDSTAKLWLANTFLLYPGFNAGEYGGSVSDYDS